MNLSFHVVIDDSLSIFFFNKQNSEKQENKDYINLSAGDALAKQHEQKTMNANLLIIGKKKTKVR